MPLAPIKMDELLVSWLGSDAVYENALGLIEQYRAAAAEQQQHQQAASIAADSDAPDDEEKEDYHDSSNSTKESKEKVIVIPPFYPLITSLGKKLTRRRNFPRQADTWDPLPPEALIVTGDMPANNENSAATDGSSSTPAGTGDAAAADATDSTTSQQGASATPNPPTVPPICVRDQVQAIMEEQGQTPPPPPDQTQDLPTDPYLTLEGFVRITKEVCRFPSFFNQPLYDRILDRWNATHFDHRPNNSESAPTSFITAKMLEWYWNSEMEPFDASERFFRLVKQPHHDYIVRDDFLPFIKALLSDHPGLEFLSNHAEFQEKYAVTVITRIFYSVNRCHSGRITSRQIRRSDLLEAFQLVDEEEDINKVTRYFSYEHFYVLYCRFWELDHDRDYKITRDDLLKYGDHSLSHMIVDRIFDAAPRPFETERVDREFLAYEDFIYFMLSEEDKANEISVRYWFTCVDVDGDSKLNNMEMRSFYAVQLHRMQCMGHEIVPFEDMLCQMMDMIKPSTTDHLIVEDFLQTECAPVSGALFDALFNLNKYLMFEQRDPFVERQKREDEFETDWDRFACIDYNRLAMEEEVNEEADMEIDWVNVDGDDEDGEEFHGTALATANNPDEPY